jgi:NADH-quinone oxidoreductase subunit N
MTFSLVDIAVILPETLLILYACAILLIEPLVPASRKEILAYASLVALALAGFASFRLMHLDYSAFSGMYLLDPFSTFFKFLLYLAAALVILLSMNYIRIEKINLGEYYAFLLIATAGMMVMVSGGDLITIYLGLELTSICFYILAGFKRYEERSTEASAKYFVLGSFSSGVLLYGISILYGLAGTTNLKDLASFFAASPPASSAVMTPGGALIVAMVLLTVGFGFKVAAVPFHMWTPDVYEGAPTPITAFLSVGSKAASFAVFLRVFLSVFGGVQHDWQAILIVLSVVTMGLGNVVAIAQENVKRMLAYSSIAHAGYAMIGLVVGDRLGIYSLMLYLMIYAFMNLGAFGVVILLQRGGMSGEAISDFTGLAKKHPLYAFLMLVFMFSLAGLPPTAGFVAKFYVFMAAVNAHLAWLAVIGVIFSAISAYFYLRIVMVMYMKEPAGETMLAPSPALSIALLVAVAVVVLVGIFPGPLIDYAQTAILAIR